MESPQWVDDYLDINGKLHYVRTGNGDKPPLVLVHGFSDNGTCWQQTALDLEDSYDIIMPDARGHGLSARVREGEGLDLAADLAAIIEALGVEKPIVWGHSMGAATAFDLGVRFPDIPLALILEDPPWFEVVEEVVEDEDGKPARPPMSTWLDTIEETPVEDFMAQTRAENPNWPDWVINSWCPAKKQLDLNFLSVMRLNRLDWKDNVPTLTCPTLIVTADTDKGGLVSPEVAAKALELNDLCTVIHVPGTGHHVRFEDYDTYMELVTPFLGEQG